MAHLLEFDPVSRATVPKTGDNGFAGPYSAQSREEGIVKIDGRLHRPVSPGNTLVMWAGKRYAPGIAVMDCHDVVLSDVTVHHCGGMGVIAQRTRDIRMERVRVTPSRDRVVSATADATHFVNCAGEIRIDDCLFENQLDDPVNIHGIYARISRRESPRTLEVELVHGQQRGVDITQAGDEVEFVSNQNLLTYHEARVESFERLNRQYYRLTLESDLPVELKTGDGIASLGWIPDVTVTRTTARNNRARGFLVSTAGKVRIEDNDFHTPGAAVFIAGDANYWFESGKVRDVVIRNNRFDRCLYGAWGNAVIAIAPEIRQENRAGTAYHRNITIEGNRFDLVDHRLLRAHCVERIDVPRQSRRLRRRHRDNLGREQDDRISTHA